MISRTTVIGALVVAELAIVGMAAQAIAGDRPGSSPLPGALAMNHASAATVEKDFVTGPTPHVVVDVSDVHVIVQAGSSANVHVTGQISRHGWVSSEVPNVVAVQTPDGVRITAPADERHVVISFGWFERSVQVTVPPTARVEVANAERVDASGLRAKFIAHIVEGPIYVRDHRGDVDVSCATGRIVLTDVQGSDIAANTRDGRLLFTRVGADRIDAVTNSGRIAAVDLRVVDGALLTHDGRVSVSFTGDTDATVNVHTDDGKIHAAGLSATSNDAGQSTVTLGSGRGRFEVSSGDGSITLTQGASV
jgi:Putative adhesin